MFMPYIEEKEKRQWIIGRGDEQGDAQMLGPS